MKGNPAVDAALKRIESRPDISTEEYKPENGWGDWSDAWGDKGWGDWEDKSDGPRY